MRLMRRSRAAALIYRFTFSEVERQRKNIRISIPFFCFCFSGKAKHWGCLLGFILSLQGSWNNICTSLGQFKRNIVPKSSIKTRDSLFYYQHSSSLSKHVPTLPQIQLNPQQFSLRIRFVIVAPVNTTSSPSPQAEMRRSGELTSL